MDQDCDWAWDNAKESAATIVAGNTTLTSNKRVQGDWRSMR
ncbi:MAG TPA: hypothetical protein VMV69_09110 [Pirellulales bacterium]|nr:hypothetical protein [Pirellulales bacterium]